MSSRRHETIQKHGHARNSAAMPPVAAPPHQNWRRVGAAGLCLLSAALLLASFPPFDLWPLAYVGLVPVTMVAVGAARGRWPLLWAYLGGMVFWGAGIYWLSWITWVGYAALIPYLGLYWLVPAWLLRRAHGRGWPMWLCLPTLWVALEYARGFALGGFPWFYLAHSQYLRAQLVQIADLTGQFGLSFFVGMVNGAMVDVLLGATAPRAGDRPRPWRKMVLAAAACVVAAAALLAYGAWRLGQQTTRPGPTLGVVQQAFPNSLFVPGAESQDIFEAHVRGSRALAGCDLVVWPESMIAYPNMDPAYWARLDPDAPSRENPARPAFTPQQQEIIRLYRQNLQTLSELIRQLDCPMLIGANMPLLDDDPSERLSFNSALLYERTPSGQLAIRARYAKMHLVPFGEYVPFRQDWPGLYRWLRSFVPEAMPQLKPGERVTRFEAPIRRAPAGAPATRPARTFRFVVPICYEGAFDRDCREMVMADGRKAADVLINISNDGWFIHVRSDGSTHASTELEQHLAQYVFRAVETRVPVVRAVNTGISGAIDSNGRVRAKVQRDGQCKMVAAALAVQTLVDTRVSVYSLVGNVFAVAATLAAALGAAILLGRARPGRGKAEQA